MRPTWCEIHLDHLKENYNAIKKLVGDGVDLMPVVKADGYGHGAIQCAKILADIGADRFAVAIAEEGIQLRKAGITTPILVLGYSPRENISDLLRWDLTPTVYDVKFTKELSEKADKKVNVHIKVDTGMNRLGFKGIHQSIISVEEIYALEHIEIEGIYSHFAVSDEIDKNYSYRQIALFNEIIEKLEEKGIEIPIKHFSNSAAIIDLPESYYNCVRPGIMLYGMYPSEEVQKERIVLKPVKSFKTRVSNIKEVLKGESVSYGRRFIAEDNRIIATLAVGYADGYSRLLSNKGEVVIKGQRAKIVGTVCMDQCMVDVTHIPEVSIGEEVLLYGKGLPIEEVAEKMGTIQYEITCMTCQRVPKFYYWKNNLIKLDNFLVDGP